MGDQGFHVVPADMTHDQGQWNAASAALGRAATKAQKTDTIAFGSFAPLVKDKYASAGNAVSSFLTSGQTSLSGMATNLANNDGQYGQDDQDSDGKVRGAGAGGGGGGGGAGAGTDSGAGDHGGKGKDHYAELMSVHQAMPTDPKDPEITFDRNVDPETGEVTWTPREMKPGEAVATDGRDVERIPQRADRIVVTMVDGEPQITYVDKDADTSADKGRAADARWEAAVAEQPTSRVVAGSGALEPGPQVAPQSQTEWTRALPAGADYAVVEVREGQPHLVFLDVNGTEVQQVSDAGLGAKPAPVDPAPATTQEA